MEREKEDLVEWKEEIGRIKKSEFHIQEKHMNKNCIPFNIFIWKGRNKKKKNVERGKKKSEGREKVSGMTSGNHIFMISEYFRDYFYYFCTFCFFSFFFSFFSLFSPTSLYLSLSFLLQKCDSFSEGTLITKREKEIIIIFNLM